MWGWGQGLVPRVGGWARGGRLAAFQPQLNALGKQQHREGCWRWAVLQRALGAMGGVGGVIEAGPPHFLGLLLSWELREQLPSRGRRGWSSDPGFHPTAQQCQAGGLGSAGGGGQKPCQPSLVNVHPVSSCPAARVGFWETVPSSLLLTHAGQVQAPACPWWWLGPVPPGSPRMGWTRVSQ